MHKSVVGKTHGRGQACRNNGIRATKEGASQEGAEMIGSKTSSASSDISIRLNIMAGFLYCRNASTNMQSRRHFSDDTRNSKTCLAEIGEVKKQRTQHLLNQHHPKRGWGSHQNLSKRGWGSHQDLSSRKRVGTQGSRKSVGMWCINSMPSLLPVPSKISALQTRGKRGGIGAFSSIGPCSSYSYESPLPLVDNGSVGAEPQWGKGTGTNQHQEPIQLSACHHWIPYPECHASRSWPRGGWGAPLHLSCLTLRENRRSWKSGFVVFHHFSLSSSLGVDLCSLSPPMTLAKLSTSVGTVESNPHRYF